MITFELITFPFVVQIKNINRATHTAGSVDIGSLDDKYYTEVNKINK